MMMRYVALLTTIVLAGCEASQEPVASTSPPPNPAAQPMYRLEGRIATATIPAGAQKFRLNVDTVTCASPIALGLARSIWPHSFISEYQTRAFASTQCVAPGAGPTFPASIQPLHFQDVTWRVTFDGGSTWVGGPMRVALVEGKGPDGKSVTTYVADDDLSPLEPAAPSVAAKPPKAKKPPAKAAAESPAKAD